MTRVAKVGLVTALAVGLFVTGGIGAFRSLGNDGRSTTQVTPNGTEALLKPAVGSASLIDEIASLQDRLRVLPSDWRSFASLGLAYVQQARVSADPSYYPKAQGVLQRSLSLNDTDNFQALVGMGALALARHDFSGALQWGERAKAVNPYNGNVYGVIGDAQIELGDYAAAFRTFQTMVDTDPSIASYARVSYARELQGDVAGAIRSMTAALDAAGSPDDSAWASFQLGELFFNSGHLTKAAAFYRRGVELAPSYVPPHAGLAKVAWARGETSKAIARYTWVVQRYPSPEYVIALGDLYATNGQQAEADQQYALVHAEQQLFAANGVNVDLELALFDADHGKPVDALAAARAEWDRRHSVHVADALAWALHANGMDAQAWPFERQALKLGTQNALFFFHAGMIRLALHAPVSASTWLRRAIDTNPHFSILYAGVAADTLAGSERSR